MGILLTVAVIALATAGGAAAELRWRERAAAAARASLVIVVYLLLPFVAFFNLARLELTADVGVGIALAYVALAITTGVAATAARTLRLSRPSSGALLNSTLIANTGYLGYPLCLSLLGADSLGEAVVYDVLVASPLLYMGAFAVGAAFGERTGETVGERVRAFFTRNPALFAAVAGLLAPESLAPDALLAASRALVIALLPLGFFVVGSTLAEELELGALRIGSPPRPPVAVAIGLRLLLAPALLYLIALPLIDLPAPYLLLAAMPSGINTLAVAHIYGLDIRLAAEAVAWSTALVVIAALAAAAVA